jgi:hypothetical protein
MPVVKNLDGQVLLELSGERVMNLQGQTHRPDGWKQAVQPGGAGIGRGTWWLRLSSWSRGIAQRRRNQGDQSVRSAYRDG